MIDFDQVRATVSLSDVINIDQLKRVTANEYAGACPFCQEGQDRFHVHLGWQRWMCRHCSPKWRDVVDYVAKRDNISVGKAIYRLVGDDLPIDIPSKRPERPSVRFSEPPPVEWQIFASKLLERCVSHLHEGFGWLAVHPAYQQMDWQTIQLQEHVPDAVKAIQWLRYERGFSDETILTHHIGYSPSGYLKLGQWSAHRPSQKTRTYLPAGVIFPHFADGQLYAIKGRGLQGKFKHFQLVGGSTCLFNSDALLSECVDTAIVVEGERDCLLLSQFVPSNVAVVTACSASNLARDWRLYFVGISRLFLAFDQDKAGQGAFVNWQKAFPHAQVMPTLLQQGEDITDAWKRGEDLEEWVSEIVLKQNAYLPK